LNPEEAKKIKCDRCGAVIGLHRHADGWRCPQCIWNVRTGTGETVDTAAESGTKRG